MNRFVSAVLLALFWLLSACTHPAAQRPPPVDAAVIAKSVHQEPALLEQARDLPAAKAYAAQPHFQDNRSSCGPATVVNVLQSFGTPVEGEKAAVEGTGFCPDGICMGGLTLDELADVLRARGLKVTLLRDLTPEQFQEHLKLSNDPSRRYVVNFTRQPIFGMGGGHHSPLGGYLEERDLAYVVDVNGSFEPWLVEREKLFAAIDTVDTTSGKKRGLLLVEAADPVK